MKKLFIISLMITPFVGAFGGCCNTCYDHQEEATTTVTSEEPTKNASCKSCPDCRPGKDDDRSPQGCAPCSADGKHERQCGTCATCGEPGIQARCKTCPVEK